MTDILQHGTASAYLWDHIIEECLHVSAHIWIGILQQKCLFIDI